MDRVGERFGRLQVVAVLNGEDVECQCDCGSTRAVNWSGLKAGGIKSCGCLRRENARKQAKKINEKRAESSHGMVGSPEYRAWQDMLNRCRNAGLSNYNDYGGRGISVCERWKKFENFLEDMGKRPFGKYSIERVDNDGDYEPDNCKWANSKEQSRNRRTNRFLTVGDRTMCVTDWERRLGVSKGCIRHRLKRGWSELDAVTVPSQK